LFKNHVFPGAEIVRGRLLAFIAVRTDDQIPWLSILGKAPADFGSGQDHPIVFLVKTLNNY
jgi:hypothetical protein